jgi:spermidine/putrescine transport system ATP-binding protein
VIGGIELQAVTKRFDELVVVDELDLQIRPGEFLSLLGPSGCGKTTTLRMIGGFEHPSAGKILLSGNDVTNVPPNRRAVNTVFQSYALFPHLSVEDNVGYALRLRKTPKAEIAGRVRTALDAVQMTKFAQRKPRQLSGGQQQRVALARAIVCEPEALLLDEPLSALDLKLRQAMRIELKHLHERLGMTFVFVTHDQGEALTMSDRVAVMNHGKVLHIAAPEEVYEHPATRYVASFIGDTNLVEAQVTSRDSDTTVTVRVADTTMPATCLKGHVDLDATVTVSIRPHRVDLLPESSAGPGLGAQLTELIYLGDATQATVALDNGSTMIATKSNQLGIHPYGDVRPGDRVRVTWERHAAQVLVA